MACFNVIIMVGYCISKMKIIVISVQVICPIINPNSVCTGKKAGDFSFRNWVIFVRVVLNYINFDNLVTALDSLLFLCAYLL